jgi:glycosyltransferase involved in cell wall biosynthesis
MFEYCRDYKYVALMDADDLAPEDRLQIEYTYLEEHEDVASVSGVLQLIDENDQLGIISDDGIRSDEEIKKTIVFRNPLPNGSTMFRMSALMKNNLRYREKFFCAQDYMFYSEMAQKCKMVKLPYILLYYRMNENNVSTTSFKKKKKRDRLLDEIHRFNFDKGNVKLNFFERFIFLRGFRDTYGSGRVFRMIFNCMRKWYVIKHPEYRGYI